MHIIVFFTPGAKEAAAWQRAAESLAMADVVGLFTLYGLVAAVILLIWFIYAIGRFVWSYVVGRPSTRKVRQPRSHLRH